MKDKTIGKRERGLSVYVFITIALSLVGVVLRTLNLLCFYDSDIGYYSYGAVLPTVASCFNVASVAFFLIGSIVLAKKKAVRSLAAKENTLFVKIVSVTAIPVFVAFSLLTLYKVIEAARYGVAPSLMSVLAVVSAMGSAVFFALVAFDKHRGLGGILSVCCVIIWLVTALGSSYFDDYIMMNSPDKLVFHMACLSGMIFFAAYIRAAIDAPKKIMFLAASSMALFFTLQSSIPSIIGSAAGVLYRYILLFEDIVLLIPAVFVFGVLLSAALNKDLPESEPENELSALFESEGERAEYASEETERELDAPEDGQDNQESEEKNDECQ